MAQTMVNFRMDEKLKEKMEKTYKDIDRNGYKGLGHPEPLTGDL